MKDTIFLALLRRIPPGSYQCVKIRVVGGILGVASYRKGTNTSEWALTGKEATPK